MTKPHAELKTRRRAARENWPEFLALRVHRALSWLGRAERCEDDDGRCVFLWVAFNAADAGPGRTLESQRFSDFLGRLAGPPGRAAPTATSCVTAARSWATSCQR